MRRIKLALTIVACLLTACAPVATNSNPQRKLDSEITQLDSIAIILAEIRALDQGIRDNSSLFFANSRAFNLHTDSLCFSKAIWVIEHYGYIDVYKRQTYSRESLGRLSSYQTATHSATTVRSWRSCHRFARPTPHSRSTARRITSRRMRWRCYASRREPFRQKYSKT